MRNYVDSPLMTLYDEQKRDIQGTLFRETLRTPMKTSGTLKNTLGTLKNTLGTLMNTFGTFWNP